MDHEAAIGTEAAERYMLDEMTIGERDAFEEHLFSCGICADDVRALEAIRQGVREDRTSREHGSSEVVPFASRLKTAIPWAVAASLMLFAGYQNAVFIPRLAANVPPPIELQQAEVELKSETRAGETPPVTIRANQPVTFYTDVVHQPQFVGYRYELRRGDEVLGFGPIAPAQVQTASVSLLVRPLPAGSYEVVIEGVRKDGNRSPVTRHSVVVEEGPGVRAEEAP